MTSLTKIPKIIHQTWIQGEEMIPEELVEYKKQIQELHKDWTYILWDEIMILDLIKKTNKDWLKVYYKFEYLHQKVDYAKLIILYLYGGIFIDMDAYTIKKLDGLIDEYSEYDFIISYVKDINFIANYGICRKTSQCLNNGNFLAKPNSDILKYMIDNITYKCSLFDTKINCISKTTGPLFFNETILEYMSDNVPGKKSKIKILGNEFLEPCTLNICEVTDNTYIKHEHSQSWINEDIQFIIKTYLEYTNTCNFCILLIFILILYFILLFLFKKQP